MASEQITQLPEPNVSRAGRQAVTDLTVTGMTCGNCARHVTEAIQSFPGVRSALVSLDNHSASVRWSEGAQPDAAGVVQAIEQAGYGARVVEAAEQEDSGHKPGHWEVTLWVGVLGTVPLMLGEWVFSVGEKSWFEWLSLGFASVVQFIAGRPFYVGAWKQLKVRTAGMDTLVALGSSTAFGYSAWALFTGTGGHLYFMESAAIITLISVGHWLESRTSARASSALRELLDLAPPRARRREAQGEFSEVPVADLEIAHEVVVRPGERVPIDGQVLEGQAAVNESMLTGESVPVEKARGDLVYAGTLNLNGELVIRVTATGQETALAHIIEAVQRAQTSRANIQRLGDRVSSVFVPIVVALALAAGLWWGLAPKSAAAVHASLAGWLWHSYPPIGAVAAGFIIASAVLIVACPCAMGLATPAAIMAATNAATKRGILIRDGVALEKAGKITAVLFDKTGTLTLGKLTVVDVWEPNQIRSPKPEDRRKSELATAASSGIQGLAAALARRSTHPISRAVAELSSDGPFLSNWEEIRGAGVLGTVQSPVRDSQTRVRARLGSLPWLAESGVDLQPGNKFIGEWSARGSTVVGLAVEESLRGLFVLQDTVKPTAKKALEHLSRQGLKIYLVTGDRESTAAAIAAQAGIERENVFAEVRPEQKAELVKKLQGQGERIGFVGDGINDAPALEQADLGIAVSRASDIAREAADIILLHSDIESVPESLGLARAALRTIKQNLFWAFFYNILAIPLAGLGFMSPVLCAAAMGLSDLVVIGNALRLLKWRSAGL